MAFVNLYSELTGCVPRLSFDYAKTLINRAWADIRRKNLWSFQLFEANWVSPAILNAGTVTTVEGTNTVVFDATASTAILALGAGPFPAPITQRQFRVGIGTIYNIWAIANNAGVVTLTLDRPYAEASGTGQAYAILQCYYPAPYQDFLMWMNVRDIINFQNLGLELTRNEIDRRDPQRTIFYIPTEVVYYQQDQNPSSATYGVPMFELWGLPTYVLTYQLAGIRKGTPLVNDTDNLPPAVGEDCVVALGKYYAYQWAEANWQSIMPDARSKPDFRFLMGAAKAEYDGLYKDYRRQDRETVDNYFSIYRRRSWLANIDGFYNAIGQSANPGAPW